MIKCEIGPKSERWVRNAFKIFQKRCAEVLVRQWQWKWRNGEVRETSSGWLMGREGWGRKKSHRHLSDFQLMWRNELEAPVPPVEGTVFLQLTFTVRTEDSWLKGREVWNLLSSDFLCWGIKHDIRNEWCTEKSVEVPWGQATCRLSMCPHCPDTVGPKDWFIYLTRRNQLKPCWPFLVLFL